MNCRTASQLLSEAQDRELTREERAAVNAHLDICPACRRCERQFELLRRIVRKLAGG